MTTPEPLTITALGPVDLPRFLEAFNKRESITREGGQTIQRARHTVIPWRDFWFFWDVRERRVTVSESLRDLLNHAAAQAEAPSDDA